MEKLTVNKLGGEMELKGAQVQWMKMTSNLKGAQTMLILIFKGVTQLVNTMGSKMQMMATQGENAGKITCVSEIGVDLINTYCPISWTDQKVPSHTTSRCCRLQ